MSKKKRSQEKRKNGAGRRGDPHHNKYASCSKADTVRTEREVARSAEERRLKQERVVLRPTYEDPFSRYRVSSTTSYW
ncbi:hypothetical protein CMI41_04120 [Candidatus Pacearchaeota archaeon]|nr:hypothetical protein [Candidatus Pacearchaeota archaeon]|tara:strand:+ start:7270 stop:7503 length:234 start_codon:yes stop_codon:yes gene_type:complete